MIIIVTIVVLFFNKLVAMASKILSLFYKPALPKNYSQVIKQSSTNAQALYRHCEKGTTEAVDGEIQGKIPEWLNGTLIRNGPGVMRVGDDAYNHLFDGMAVLHRYHVSNGKATYTSRALESDTYRKNMAANRIVVSEFGTVGFPDPCKTIFQRLQSTFESVAGKSKVDVTTDNCSVNVAYYGDQLYAMTETDSMRRISPKDLTSIGDRTKISDYIAVNHATAHPHIERDGTVYNVGSSYRSKSGPHYSVMKIPPTFGQEKTSYAGASVAAEIPFTSKRHPCYYHSFGITKDKLIFVESPLRLDVLKLIKMAFVNTSFAQAMKWDPTLKTRFHVASLVDGKNHPVVYESDAFFTFHHINSYEENGQLIVDVAGYDRGDIVFLLENDTVNPKTDLRQAATARRFVIPLTVNSTTAGKNLVTLENSEATAVLQAEKSEDGKPRVFLTPQHLTQDWMELPRINYNYNAQDYKYFYALGSHKSADMTSLEPDLIAKVDVVTKESKRWSEEGKIPSEPVFIANPAAANEDDGVVLSALMHEKEEKRVTLLVLDAKNMTELARVKFQTAGTFTGTFHGQWANQADKIHLN